jgi:hypothetical protein
LIASVRHYVGHSKNAKNFTTAGGAGKTWAMYFKKVGKILRGDVKIYLLDHLAVKGD